MTTQILAIRSSRLATWASIGFVPLWSSGIVFGALALRFGPPFAVTALRFAAAPILGEWPLPTTLIAIVLGAVAVRLLMTERR